MKQAVNSPGRPFIILAFAFCIFFSCNENKSGREETKTSTDTTALNSNNTNNNTGDSKEQVAALSPLSSDELKSLLPPDLSGAAAENSDVSSATGATTATATYKLNDSTSVQLSLADGAGPAGSGFLSTQYYTRIGSGGTGDYKIIDFKGQKAILEQTADSDELSLTWLVNDRYLFTLYGQKINAEQLKRLAAEVKIK